MPYLLGPFYWEPLSSRVGFLCVELAPLAAELRGSDTPPGRYTHPASRSFERAARIAHRTIAPSRGPWIEGHGMKGPHTRIKG